MYKDTFEDVAKGKLSSHRDSSWRPGSMVRLIGGQDPATGRPKYRAYRITGELSKTWFSHASWWAGIEPDGGDGKYQIEFKGREVSEDRVLRVKYGKVERLFRIADVSNGDFEEVRLSPLGQMTVS